MSPRRCGPLCLPATNTPGQLPIIRPYVKSHREPCVGVVQFGRSGNLREINSITYSSRTPFPQPPPVTLKVDDRDYCVQNRGNAADQSRDGIDRLLVATPIRRPPSQRRVRFFESPHVGQVVNLRAEWYSAQTAKPAVAARFIFLVIRKLRHEFRSSESRLAPPSPPGRAGSRTAFQAPKQNWLRIAKTIRNPPMQRK